MAQSRVGDKKAFRRSNADGGLAVQEICVLFLDVGQGMTGCLDHASKACSNFLLSKVLPHS